MSNVFIAESSGGIWTGVADGNSTTEEKVFPWSTEGYKEAQEYANALKLAKGLKIHNALRRSNFSISRVDNQRPLGK
ncbi:MAG: hypothetical protein GY804_11650 [Alphaproteobacteria bacterium]|nr:hypothetical protein [Alphaproteobacteria bacterium]